MSSNTRIPSHLERHYDYDARISVDAHLHEVADRRRECPMSYSDGYGDGYWVASSYDTIADVLRRRQGFTSYPVGLDSDVQSAGGRKLIPIELDGELHQRYRSLLNPLFTPATAQQLEPSMRVLANQLIDKFVDRGECDVVSEFARLLPGTLFLRMMGWPVEDADMFYGWVEASMHASPEEAATLRLQVAQERNKYMGALIDARRRTPEDDLTTVLAHAEIDGKPISDEDLLLLFRLLMAAGLDTVQSVLSQSFVFLAQHPEFREQMLEPAVLPGAVEELLRWASPAVPTRTALEPVNVGGIDLQEGERVHCPLGAANRDPAYYADPDTPRLDREDPKPHLTFGLGPHRCLGSHIARVELKVAFEEWHRRIPNYRIGSRGIGDWHLGGVWGVDSVHLEF